MTEEIIIDGVNVAGCVSFDKNNGHNICCYDDTREDKIPFANFCVENKDCAYKQLKRLEQENKELKEENKQHIKEKQILHERLYCYAYEKDCHLVCKQQNCLLKNSYSYRSALEEIREWLIKWQYDANILKHTNEPLNKINEVLNENQAN